MANEDGEELLKNYLNGLPWTDLTEPKYYLNHEQGQSLPPNSVILRQIGIKTDPSSTVYWLIHIVETIFEHDTKANAYANFKYILKNIINYNANGAIKMELQATGIRYTDKRKKFIITVTVSEMLSLT
jgi:hypothetical protein